jgi:glycosyltransferase involved in cell wall biosynthesis
MKPKLSVVMPAKNAEKFLNKTIDSILKQSFQDWELIFIDDHSTDNTAKTIHQLNDSRIKYFFLDKGSGVAAGRDFGTRKAGADIIVNADADDIYYSNRLEKINSFFEQNLKTDVFYSGVDFFYLDSGKKITRPFQSFNPEILRQVNFIANSSTAFKKSPFLSVNGYDTTLKMCEDYDLWLRFLDKGFLFGYIEESLVQINRYSDSTTGTRKDLLKEYIHQVKRKSGLPPVADINFLKKVVVPEVYDYFTTPGGKFLWFE